MPINTTFNSLSVRGWRAGIPPSGLFTGPANINFGRVVRISYDGKYMAIGTLATGVQNVSVYSRGNNPNGWTFQSNLVKPGIVDFWGYQLEINSAGDKVIIGSPQDRAAYFFDRTGEAWAQGATIAGPVNSNFGASIGMSGDAAYVGGGSFYDTGLYMYTGAGASLGTIGTVKSDQARFDATGTRAIYGENIFANYTCEVLVRSGTTWSVEANLAALVPDSVRSFNISSNGQFAVLGCPLANGNLGRVYVLQRTLSTWSILQTLNSPFPVANEKYGVAVDINSNGTRLIVGTGLNTTSANSSAYVVSNIGGLWASVPLTSGFSGISNYGAAVTISQTTGDYAVVTDPAAGRIFCYHYTPTGWTLENR